MATFPGPIAALTPRPFDFDVEREFRNIRTAALIAVNANTFWFIAIIVLAFGLWDWYVDDDHWRAAFVVRLWGEAIIVATGLFQRLPGRMVWMPLTDRD